MDTQQVVVATITWARTAAEADLLDRSLAALVELELPIVVTNRGDHTSFLDRLQSHANVHVARALGGGLVSQVRESVTRASGLDRRFILYTEPDKLQFFTTGLREFIANAPDGNDIGVVLAGRSSAAWSTFPPLQRRTEEMFNELCRHVIGVATDYCYGPFLMQNSLASHVAQLPDDLGWGWRPALFRAARRRGLQLQDVCADYVCPDDQRHEDEDERSHRLRQLSQNIRGLVD